LAGPTILIRIICQIFGIDIMDAYKKKPISRKKEDLKSFQYSGKNS